MRIFDSLNVLLGGEPMESSLIIDVRGLRKDFGDLHAVDGVDLHVDAGEIFGILGPDGAGKTTSIRMLVGIVDPTGGGGSVLGHDMVTDREGIKTRIGYMSQRFSLYGDLTVAENLDFFSEIYEVPISERKEREKRMLDFSRLHPFRDRLAQNLSGGMKQKLALACTLMHTPSLLFLDEPTTGVDPVSRRDFWKILYQLVADGMTIVISTPYMDEAERCTRIAMMDNGRIIRVDTPAALKQSVPGSLIELSAKPQRTAKEILSALNTMRSVQVFGDRLHVLCDDPELAKAEIAKALRDQNVEVGDIRVLAASLEDAFVSTIERARMPERGGFNA